MKIALAYIAVAHGPVTIDYSARFCATFKAFPPQAECDIFVVGNGGAVSSDVSIIFASLKATLFVRSNNGWDIGGYIDAANGPCSHYDAILCCGESIYFHRAGWLKRFCEVWERNGPGMYGAFSSNLVRPHLNTTGFMCSPTMLKSYPNKINSKADRYEFEHGAHSFWKRLMYKGVPVRLVTWCGEYVPMNWRFPHNILWRGDQSNCLMWCQHTDRYVNADPATKMNWARKADTPYK